MTYPRQSFFWAMVGSHLLLAFALAWTLAAGAFAFVCWSEAAALVQRGALVEGRITELWTQSSDGGTRYVGAYVFVAEGNEFTGQAKVDREDWEKLEVGGKVLVQYVQGDPSVSASLLRRDMVARYGGPDSLMLVSLGFTAVGVLVIAGAGFEVRRVRRRFWLRDHGIVRQAKVLSCDEDDGSWAITWRDAAGLDGKATGIDARIRPDVGATITVFAHATKPWAAVWEGDIGSRAG